MVFQLLDGVEVEICRLVCGRQTLRRVFAKSGIRFDLEQIGRDVGGSARFDQLQRLVELRLRIMGQSQHDVAADVGEPGIPGSPERGPGLFCGVGPPQRFQLGIPCRLHPKGDPVDACLPERPQLCFVHRLGVGLQRDLGSGQGGSGFDQPGGVGRIQQAGGAAAEVERVGAQRGVRRKPRKLPQQCVGVRRRNPPSAGCGIEIAIAAFGKTIWNMQVKSKRHRISQPFS